jgi:hypothetical protein
MLNFSSLPATQTALDKFLTIFQENFKVFQENSLTNFRKLKIWIPYIFVNKQRMFMLNFSPLPATQTHLDKFLTIFQENFRVCQENSVANFKKFQIWIYIYIGQLALHVHAKFQLSTCYSDQLRQIFDHFSRKFKKFSRKLLSEFQKNPNLNTHLYLSISIACLC